MRATLSATEVAERLFSVRTNADIEAIITAQPNAVWKPLGAKRNNHALVNVLIDPGDALVERVTNGLDAVIEQAVLRAKREDIEAPRQAVSELLSIDRGYVYNVRDDAKRRDIAKNVVVTLRDSEAEKMPTVVIDDRGIGQHPAAFETTLVSLAEENKLKRLYLMGEYGWGGAAAYSFADRYAAFVSRRHPRLLDEGQTDEVGWTIVRYDPRENDRLSKHGVYEYLCVDEGGPVRVIPHFSPSVLPEARREWSGTVCTLVQYELSRYSDPVWRPRNSLWLLFNAVLFDPVLPFLIRDERAKAIRGNANSSLNGLVINGTAAKLVWDAEKKDPKDRLIALRGSWKSRLPDGSSVVIKYWVVEEKGAPKKDWEPTWTYVTPEQAVTVTHNGQRQGSFRRELFEKLGLMSIARFLIVQVDCDGLSWRAKRELFSTTRDRLKDSPLARTLREMVAEALQSDPDLRELDRKRKEQALGRKSAEQAERIKKLLAKQIASLREGQETVFTRVVSSNSELPILGDQPLLEETTEPTPASETTEPAYLEFPDEPTQLRVLNPVIQVRAGGKAVVRLALDARDDYITTSDEPQRGGKFTGIVTKGADQFRVVGNSDLRRGIMRCTISAEKAQPGDRGRIVFTVARPSRLPLLDEADVIAIEPPQPRAKPAGKQQGPEQGPNVFAVTRDEWNTFDFDEKTVARVEENSPQPGMVTVYVNWDYPPLDKKLMAEKKAVGERIEDYKEKFTAAMALLAWLQSEQQDPDNVLPRQALDAELRRGADLFLFTKFVD